MKRRWELVAIPVTDKERIHFSEALSEAWNTESTGNQYWTKLGAIRAAQFFTRELGIPVEFSVRRIREDYL